MNYPAALLAHRLLEQVREGFSIPAEEVNKALRVTGDAVGLKEFDDDGNQILILERR